MILGWSKIHVQPNEVNGFVGKIKKGWKAKRINGSVVFLHKTDISFLSTPLIFFLL